MPCAFTWFCMLHSYFSFVWFHKQGYFIGYKSTKVVWNLFLSYSVILLFSSTLNYLLSLLLVLLFSLLFFIIQTLTSIDKYYSCLYVSVHISFDCVQAAQTGMRHSTGNQTITGHYNSCMNHLYANMHFCLNSLQLLMMSILYRLCYGATLWPKLMRATVIGTCPFLHGVSDQLLNTIFHKS